MTQEIIPALAQYIATAILKQSKKDIKPDDKLISSGLIDSFSLIDLSIHIENTYGVRIEDTELTAETFDTLVELAELIQQRL